MEKYLNPDLPVQERVKDLVSRMTLDDKISQMMHSARAIPDLGIPEYNWWNECLHGVGRAGIATVFPQAIGLAATWDTELIYRVAVAISDEARAKHHEALQKGDRGWYKGLTCWSPNINIFRDPRWGRGQETYGEDPYLTARMGVSFVKGLQGEDERYLKLVATPKHFAVHSGPEQDRHRFNVKPSPHDFRETYLPAFKACVQEGKAVSVMGAYNRIYGEPCCASFLLLEEILRQEWGFDGFVVSDCGAIDDLYFHHEVVESLAEAAAMAVRAGCDLNCGETYSDLKSAVGKGLINEAEIDRSIERLFTARFRLGMFDPPDRVPFSKIPVEINDCPAHRQLALVTARESIVLLKNDGLLPLKGNLGSIAVIGPNANDANVLLGNYNGTPAAPITILEGIRQMVSPDTEVRYARGCSILGKSQEGFPEAVRIAGSSDIVIVVLGLSQAVEGEEGQEEGVTEGDRSNVDRVDLDLPGVQEQLLQAIHATGKPVILVLINGSAVAVNWANDHLPAILEAWYPGQAGGRAVAETLFGNYNPGGRLPVTFYKSVDQLPAFTDYSMTGRTYRYFQGESLYPFGFGLSYTSFGYRNLTIEADTFLKTCQVSVEVQNTGGHAGDEVAQIYLKSVEAPFPIWQLRGFERFHLEPGETRKITFDLNASHLTSVDEDGKEAIFPGEYRVAVGGCFPGSDIETRVDSQGRAGDIWVGGFKM